MSVDDLMALLEGHPSATPVLAVSGPPAAAVFVPVAVQAPLGPAPAAVLLVLRPVLDTAPASQSDGGPS